MSIALKKQQFRTQIRRESIKKILKQKKEIFQTERQVNQVFSNYIDDHHNLSSSLPRICAIKFQFLTEDNKYLLIKLVRQRQIKLDFSKPQNVLLINKISFIQKGILSLFVQDVTAFADKMLFSLSGNEKLWIDKDYSKPLPQPSHEILQNLMLFPNCLLQFWGQFFSIKQSELQIRTYCTILKAFNYWFCSKSNFFKHFNKYSFCLFMKNFMKFQNILSFQTNFQTFKPVQELFIRFRVVSTPIIGILLEEGFLNDDFLEILKYIAENRSQNSLLRSLSCRLQKKMTFFTYLMNALEDQSYLLKKQNQSQFLFSQQMDQDQLKTLKQFSIQCMIYENLSQKYWQRKVYILELMNNYLNFQRYQSELLRTDLKWMVQRLFCVYIYCEERGVITQKIQRIISILVFNILLLVQNSLQSQRFSNNQLQIDLGEGLENFKQQQDKLSKQDQQQEKQFIKIEQMLRQYFTDNLDTIRIIHKSSFQSAQQIVELLSLLNQISHFCNNKEFDEKILDSNIIERICSLLIDKIFNSDESSIILESLLEFLSNLHNKNFIFNKYSNQFELLKHSQIQTLLSESHQSLLNEIYTGFQ